MADLHHFKLVIPDRDPTKATIELDGRPLKGVKRLELVCDARGGTTLKLEMIGHMDVHADLYQTYSSIPPAGPNDG